MTDGLTPDPGADGSADMTVQQDFIKARKRRNIVIAWSLVAFMVLVFSITALRLTQNLAARQEAAAEQAEGPMANGEIDSDE